MLISRYSFLLFLAVFTVQWCGAEPIFEAVQPSTLLAYSTSRNGDSIEKGTAFLFDHNPKDSLVYLVTCKHLVDSSSTVVFYRTFMEGMLWQYSNDGQINATQNPVIDETNDIALFPVSRAEVVGRKLIPFNRAKMRDELQIGSQVYWVGGFFKTGSDSGRLMLRYGMLSLIDEEDRKIGEVLMDGISTPGFSGSPVVYLDKEKEEVYVIGMMCGEYTEPPTPVYAPMSGDDSTVVRRALPLPTGISYSVDFDSINNLIERAKSR